jgi:hypothetical protein
VGSNQLSLIGSIDRTLLLVDRIELADIRHLHPGINLLPGIIGLLRDLGLMRRTFGMNASVREEKEEL